MGQKAVFGLETSLELPTKKSSHYMNWWWHSLSDIIWNHMIWYDYDYDYGYDYDYDYDYDIWYNVIWYNTIYPAIMCLLRIHFLINSYHFYFETCLNDYEYLIRW